jgi:hypothetical protein
MGLVPLADHRFVGRVVRVEADRCLWSEFTETELDMGQETFSGGQCHGSDGGAAAFPCPSPA